MPQYHGFPQLIIYILIFLFNGHVMCALRNVINCPGVASDTKPSIHLYDANHDPTDNNESVILEQPEEEEEETIGFVGLECNYTKAIRWVFNLDFEQSGLGDSYSLTERVVEDDFYNVSTYRFKADIEFKIHVRKLKIMLMCVAFDDPCERRVVQVSYNDQMKKYVLQALPESKENDSLVKELETAIVKNYNWGQELPTDLPCAVNFSHIDNKHSFSHIFTPSGSMNIKPRKVPDRQTLENAYLFYDHLNHGCIADNCSKNPSSCYTTENANDTKYWPVVFFMSDVSNVSRVVHMYQTFGQHNNSDGQMKFAWEYSDPAQFLTMDGVPNRIYKGESVTVVCRFSPFLFSVGVKIAYTANPSNTDKMSFIDDIIDSHEEARKVSGDLTVMSGYENSKITVFCLAPLWNSSTEWVNVSKVVELLEPTLDPIKVPESGSKVFELPLKGTFSTSCNVTGTPRPTLEIVLPKSLKNTTARVNLETSKGSNWVQTNLTIMSVDETHVGFYNCVATNFKGRFYHAFEIKIKSLTIAEKIASSTLTITLISVFGSISIIFVIVVVYLLVKFKMEKEEFRRLTEEAIRDFMEGQDMSQVSPSDDPHAYTNDGVKSQPYNRKYEVSNKQWSFSGTMLGSGAFGLVQKGVVEVGSRKSIVAIKTVKSAELIDDFRATLLELKIMSTIGDHPHIVKLIAASTDEIRNRKVYIGVEFCANGSLLTYLQKRKKLFTNLVKDGQIEFMNLKNNNGDVQDEGETYMNLVTSDISTIDLYKWSFQIASGMNYLESKKVLHADLATRNILLTEGLVVKISDFGLSRELFENSEYMKKTQVALPWKWMAIESLKFLKFSILSDIWSYGVVLYEVFTLGSEPYSGANWTEQFVLSLENGMRLDRPLFCTENVYNHVMTQCWLSEPNDRIRFAASMTFFQKAIEALTSSPRKSADCRELC